MDNPHRVYFTYVRKDKHRFLQLSLPFAGLRDIAIPEYIIYKSKPYKILHLANNHGAYAQNPPEAIVRTVCPGFVYAHYFPAGSP